MSGRAAILAVGGALVVTALLLALWPALRAGGLLDATAGATSQDERRRLHVAGESTPTTLRLRFTRPNGAAGELRLQRGSEGEAWRPVVFVDAPGIVLGDGYPVFATPRFLAVHGLDAREALRPMSEELLREEADEVTVIRGWGGEVAVCLWRHDKVVRAYLAGEVFEALLAAPDGTSACDRIAATALAAEAPDAPGGDVDAAAARGAMRTAALAAMIAGCPTTRLDALEALQRACDAGEPSACDLLLARPSPAADLWPEIDDLWRWILDVVDASAAPGR